ncbi:MAG TPA: hypothetical protein VN733_05265 [Solirubrobacterales bacterium]|nr:hypothetical protein [Solirubrobacterales bacterium]
MRRGITAFLALALALLVPLALPAAALAVPPANDKFASRQILSPGFPGGTPIEETGTNVEATKEGGESIPGLSPAGHSVWFEWEATGEGWVSIGTCESEFPTLIAVFTGTEVDELDPVAFGNGSEGPDCPYQNRQYTFFATAGTKYVIAVDGNGFFLPESPPPVTEGEFELEIKETPVPSNDEFENATALVGDISEEPGGARRYFAHTQGFNWNASNEHGEPDELTSGASVWYSWTAPEAGTYSFGDPCCGLLDLDLYSGDAVGGLTPVLVGEESGKVDLTAGQTLRIRVSGPIDPKTEEPRMEFFNIIVSAELAPLPKASSGSGTSATTPPDTTTPETTISKRYLAVGTAKFWFGSNEAGSFLCRLDKAPFKPCGSPRAYKRLKGGRHTFKVKAVDAAGNADPTPAVARFKSAARPRR